MIFSDISTFCLPMIKWTFFQTSEDIYRYQKCYLPNALRPTSFSYLDLYCVGDANTIWIVEYISYDQQRKSSWATKHSPVDFFLYSAAGDESINDDVLLLSNSEGAIDRLSVSRRVPSGIVNDDSVCRSQSQPNTTNLEAEEKWEGEVFWKWESKASCSAFRTHLSGQEKDWYRSIALELLDNPLAILDLRQNTEKNAILVFRNGTCVLCK